MILMLLKVIYTNIKCILIDRFKKNTVLRSFYFTFVYHSCNIILRCIFITCFILCKFITFNEIVPILIEYLMILIIVPFFHFNFLKMLDKRDYDLYIGENARLPSFNLIDVDDNRSASDFNRSSMMSASKSFKSNTSATYAREGF